MSFILRWIATAIAVGVAVWLVPGIDISGGSETWAAVAIFALVLAFLNSFLRPILQVLGLPISIITLGIFALVINTFMLYIASWLAGGIFNTGLEIATFGSAFIASIVISIVSAIVNAVTGAKDD